MECLERICVSALSGAEISIHSLWWQECFSKDLNGGRCNNSKPVSVFASPTCHAAHALKDFKVKNYLQFKMIALVSIPTANLVRTSPLQDIQLSPFGLCSHLYLRNEPCLISVIHAAAGFPHFETYSHVEYLVARQS